MAIEEDSIKILEFLYEHQKKLNDDVYSSCVEPQKATGLSPTQINNAADFLSDAGLIEITHNGSLPFKYLDLMINARGKDTVLRRRARKAKEFTGEP